MNRKAPPPNIGRMVKSARKTHALTLAQLSERSGVSRSMLSAIERETVNPTFSVVWALTQSLGIDFNALNESTPADDPIEHVKRYSTPMRHSADGRCTLYMLNPRRNMLPVEWHDMLMEREAVLDSAAHAPGTFEHLTCLAGRISITSASKTILAEQGDTLRYRADRPHRIRNEADGPSRALLLVALPSHFSAPGK